MAGLKMEQYFDQLIGGKARLRPLPSALATLLRERLPFRVNEAGVGRAVEWRRTRRRRRTRRAGPARSAGARRPADSRSGPGGRRAAQAAPAAPPSRRTAPGGSRRSPLLGDRYDSLQDAQLRFRTQVSDHEGSPRLIGLPGGIVTVALNAAAAAGRRWRRTPPPRPCRLLPPRTPPRLPPPAPDTTRAAAALPPDSVVVVDRVRRGGRQSPGARVPGGRGAVQPAGAGRRSPHRTRAARCGAARGGVVDRGRGAAGAAGGARHRHRGHRSGSRRRRRAAGPEGARQLHLRGGLQGTSSRRPGSRRRRSIAAGSPTSSGARRCRTG